MTDEQFCSHAGIQMSELRNIQNLVEKVEHPDNGDIVMETLNKFFHDDKNSTEVDNLSRTPSKSNTFEISNFVLDPVTRTRYKSNAIEVEHFLSRTRSKSNTHGRAAPVKKTGFLHLRLILNSQLTLLSFLGVDFHQNDNLLRIFDPSRCKERQMVGI